MNIFEREGEVLEEWKKRCHNNDQTFVEDGIVDNDFYSETNPGTVFVLKEANGEKTDEADSSPAGDWSLKCYLREGARWRTWNNVTRWAIGLRQLEREIAWSDLETVDNDLRAKTLRLICAMNLKKWPGGKRTIIRELRNAVERDSDLIHKQFFLYGALFAVCCGTDVAQGLASALPLEQVSKWHKTTAGIPFTEYRTGRYVVAFSHPQASMDKHERYNTLVNACREVLRR